FTSERGAVVVAQGQKYLDECSAHGMYGSGYPLSGGRDDGKSKAYSLPTTRSALVGLPWFRSAEMSWPDKNLPVCEGDMQDPYNLQRFVQAQNPVIEQVFEELRAGSKRSHWMWFVFPQISGLGHSEMARRYAVSSIQEA